MVEKKERDILMNEFGVSGTQIINGFIDEDYRKDLQGSTGTSTYDEMRKSDAQIFATLLACELPIRQTKWYLEAQEDENGEINEKSKEITQFIENNLFKEIENTWDDLLREILTMLPFGFVVFEKVFGFNEKGQIILKKLGYRKQNTIFKWLMDNGEPGIVQLAGTPDDATEESKKNSNISIPLEKLAIFTFRGEGKNYEGISILRSAYKHWYIKDKLYKFDAIKHERQSVGIPVIYMPNGANQANISEAQRIVKNVRSTEQTGVVLPGSKADGWLFEFADTKSGNNSDLFESIKHHNREIAKNILAQFLELGDTQSGSRALSENQSDLFLLGLGSIANSIRDIFNKKIIPEIVDFNFDDKIYPELKFEKLGNINYKELVENLSSLTTSGIVEIDNELELFIRNTLDLPKKGKNVREIKTLPIQPEIKSIEKKKRFSNSCSHDHEEGFDNNYFKELVDIIDQKYIVNLHTNDI